MTRLKSRTCFSFLLCLCLFGGVFSTRAQNYYARAKTFLEKAEQLKPELKEEVIQPAAVVAIVKNDKAFQGWEARKVASLDSVYNSSFRQIKSVVVDFGDHYTGHFSMDLEPTWGTSDAPVRFRLTFGEVPAELAVPFDPYPGALSRAWLQDEELTVMHIPSTITLSRRISGRYMKIELLGSSQYFDFRISGIRFNAQTSATEEPEPLAPSTPAAIREIDRISMKTLKECMQTVYEDGPKRDRRLWVGDLYLESLANVHTFRNNQLTARCLYLLAGLSDDQGYVLGTVFESPEPHPQAGQRLMDYSLLFNVTLVEYLNATRDFVTAGDLWPVAKRQLSIIDDYVDENGMVDYERANSEWWLFFDWKDGLNKHAAIQGLMIFTLEHTWNLAEMLGRENEVEHIPFLIKKMKKAALKELYNKQTGLFETGADQQVSYASQVWMILGGVTDKKQSRRALEAVVNHKEALHPGGPYMYHYFIQALMEAGMYEQAKTSLVNYWGGMADKGADTFWEVYDPDNDFLSPYNFFPVNSYCHAWSCTPSYFIRKYPELFQQ